jgi:ABC-type hemin transport system substrate-binding protein
MRYTILAVLTALLSLPVSGQGPAKTEPNADQSAAPVQQASQPISQPKPCLIVRQAEGHRFRNSMIAGALTGGIGFAAGAASGGAKYEYVDSYNMSGTKPKYKGSELQQLQQQGVHVVTVSKKASGEELSGARDSCKQQ